MNNLTTFNNVEFGELTVITLDGVEWFRAKPIGDMMEVPNATRKDLLQQLDYEQARVFKMCDIPEDGFSASKQYHGFELNPRGEYFVSESGLYALIFRGKTDKAIEFQKWVTKEVLPSIRKTGSYSINTQSSWEIEDKRERAKKWLEEEDERIRLEQENLIMQPKVEYHDKVLDTESELTTTQIAKELGISAAKLNIILHKMKVQFKNKGSQWHLYAQHADKGYTRTRTSIVESETGEKAYHSTVWTEKGRKFIHELYEKYISDVSLQV